MFVAKEKKKKKEKPTEHFKTAALLQDRRPVCTAATQARCVQAGGGMLRTKATKK